MIFDVTPATSLALLKNTYDFPESSNPLSLCVTLTILLLFLNSFDVAFVLDPAFV